MWFLAGSWLGFVVGVVLTVLVVRTVKPEAIPDIPMPSLPKKRMKAGVYHPTNVAAVKKALRMGVDEKDVFQ